MMALVNPARIASIWPGAGDGAGPWYDAFTASRLLRCCGQGWDAGVVSGRHRRRAGGTGRVGLVRVRVTAGASARGPPVSVCFHISGMASRTHTLRLSPAGAGDPVLSADRQRPPGDSVEPSLGSWLEWKERCAAGLCSPEVQSELCGFAAVHFARYVRRYVYRTNVRPEGVCVPEKDAWHLFEAHLAVRSGRRGKRYKDWLFDRTGGCRPGSVDTVAGGAALLMRDVVREHLRREYQPAGVVSLQAPLGRSLGPQLTLEDLLPGEIDPADEVARREFEQLAESHAGDWMAGMDRRERVAWLAKGAGLSLAHPAVEKAAGCRKSVLNDVYHNLIRRVVRQMEEDYADDDPGAVRVLTLMTLAELSRRVRLWGGSITECAALLSLAEAE